MSTAATADLWWKNAVAYCLDVQTFADANGDGIGDFAGLTEHIDYLAGLGITCLWLMPFYRTADLDDYDVSDYYSIDPRLGTFGDFTEFIRTAKDRGLRVIADLVVNTAPTSTSGSKLLVEVEILAFASSTYGETRSRSTAQKARCSQRIRVAFGRTTRRRASTTSIAFTATNPISTSRLTQCARRSAR